MRTIALTTLLFLLPALSQARTPYPPRQDAFRMNGVRIAALMVGPGIAGYGLYVTADHGGDEDRKKMGYYLMGSGLAISLIFGGIWLHTAHQHEVHNKHRTPREGGKPNPPHTWVPNIAPIPGGAAGGLTLRF